MTLEAIVTMTFGEALAQVAAGQRITKLEWHDRAVWGALVDERLCLHLDDGLYHPWIVSEGDLAGTDWIVWEP